LAWGFPRRRGTGSARGAGRAGDPHQGLGTRPWLRAQPGDRGVHRCPRQPGDPRLLVDRWGRSRQQSCLCAGGPPTVASRATAGMVVPATSCAARWSADPLPRGSLRWRRHHHGWSIRPPRTAGARGR